MRKAVVCEIRRRIYDRRGLLTIEVSDSLILSRTAREWASAVDIQMQYETSH